MTGTTSDRAPGRAPVIAVVALGGAVGAGARYLVTLTLPAGAPLVILAINALGCLLMGLLVAATEHGARHRLWRPFLGTGVLGGFTTVSTYTVLVWAMGTTGPAAALAYAVVTPAVAVAAVASGAWAGRALGRVS